MKEPPIITVIDDDESVRESLPDLLRQFGFSVRAFSSAEDFLSSDCVDRTSCLILDIAMPGMTGLDLQRQLQIQGPPIPIIFITGQSEEVSRLRALGPGCVKVLPKPVAATVLIETVKHVFRENDPTLHYDD